MKYLSNSDLYFPIRLPFLKEENQLFDCGAYAKFKIYNPLFVPLFEHKLLIINLIKVEFENGSAYNGR
jgi:hypothetical protein